MLPDYTVHIQYSIADWRLPQIVESWNYSQVENDMPHMWRFFCSVCLFIKQFLDEWLHSYCIESSYMGESLVLSDCQPDFSERAAPYDYYKFHNGTV